MTAVPADQGLAHTDDAPLSPPPAPAGNSTDGAASSGGVGANPCPAVPPVAEWCTDDVLLITIRLADAIRHGRFPAVPALPG